MNAAGTHQLLYKNNIHLNRQFEVENYVSKLNFKPNKDIFVQMFHHFTLFSFTFLPRVYTACNMQHTGTQFIRLSKFCDGPTQNFKYGYTTHAM